MSVSDKPKAGSAAYWREYRAKNPATCRAAVNAYHAGIAAIIRAAKDGAACSVCGVEGLPAAALHFHHVRGRKRFTVAQWAQKFPLRQGESKADAVRAEIKKCDVICPTCHTLFHAKAQTKPV